MNKIKSSIGVFFLAVGLGAAALLFTGTLNSHTAHHTKLIATWSPAGDVLVDYVVGPYTRGDIPAHVGRWTAEFGTAEYPKVTFIVGNNSKHAMDIQCRAIIDGTVYNGKGGKSCVLILP